MEPKILFGKLKGYPALNGNGKINTEEFLSASREIVSLIDTLGKIFSPVVYDMNGNIEKLHKIYLQNTDKHIYLEDMILADLGNPDNVTTESLLWLKRALELFEAFFTNVLDDEENNEDLTKHLKEAYHGTLRPYHGWIVQQAFSVVYGWVPPRSVLFGKDHHHGENMSHLKYFLHPLRTHLSQINFFYTEYQLNNEKKA